ncbi:MAG: PLP-dependent aminotransferase family protein [candidate division Zixibacteria bacterium]|nr:PLP-dependent aminotransferase family protein [candidate division Zixibacteria bacterium]
MSWKPDLKLGGGPLYLAIYQALANDIASGKLPLLFRLPTHRELADEMGVAVGTVTRAYLEAEQRGLIHSRGRAGTFVGQSRRREPYVAGLLRTDAPYIDLSVDAPSRTEDPDLLAAFRFLARRRETQLMLQYPTVPGLYHHRVAGAKWLASLGADVDPDSIIVTSGAQNALMVIFSALSEPGDVVMLDEHTYTGMILIADALRLRLVGVPGDREGMLPDAMESICQRMKPRFLFCSPTIASPTNTILPECRRRAIADLAEKYDFMVVEDDIHRRLVPEPPPLIWSLRPERCCLVASVSKVVAAGLRVGYMATPPRLYDRLLDMLQATTMMVSGITLEIAAHWIENGTAEETVLNRRRDARARQAVAREVLGQYDYDAQPTSYFIWLRLPEPWTVPCFIAEASRRGIVVAPAVAFAVDKGKPLNAVRIALVKPATHENLRSALEILADILSSVPPCECLTI